jgi:hypothetical protein
MSSRDEKIKNRCHEIAEKLRPASVVSFIPIVNYGVEARIEYEPDGTAIVEAADPDTPKLLWTLLHEFAHAVLGHGAPPRSMLPYHLKEYECEQWALNRMREEVGELLAPALPALHADSREYVVGALRHDFPAEEGFVTEALSYLTWNQRNKIISQLNAVRDQFRSFHPMPKVVSTWPIERTRRPWEL